MNNVSWADKLILLTITKLKNKNLAIQIWVCKNQKHILPVRNVLFWLLFCKVK